MKNPKEERNIKFKIEREVRVSQQDIEDIMASAVFGVVYWVASCQIVGEMRGDNIEEHIAAGGSVILDDTEDKWELNQEKLLAGLKLWYEKGLDEYGTLQSDGSIDWCNGDAACADEIVQLGLFGEIVFA